MNQSTKELIVKHLEAYMQAHGMSAEDFSRHSGVNSSYISRIRNGHYTVVTGSKDVEIADKYWYEVARVTDYHLQKSYWEPLPTEEMKRIVATLEDAKGFGYTNLIIGETGCGKTYVCKLFAKKSPLDTWVITIGSNDYIVDVIDKIIAALKVNTTAKTKSRKINAIIRHIKDMKAQGYQPLIIFDESEYMKQLVICMMKELYDNLHGSCGIVLAGTDQLTRNIDKLMKRRKDGIPQFFRRIKFGIRRLPAIDRRFKLFLNGYSNDLQRFLIENCSNYGELHDILVPAKREADQQGEALTVDFVKTIFCM
jgi:DNA transposition AAA+ family ATPase